MKIEMESLDKVHYLKHYLGGPAMVLSEFQNTTGQIENVEIEDGSVLIRSGEESHWVDCEKVSPSLKSFKSLNDDDIKTIVDHLSFNVKKLCSTEILYWCDDTLGVFINLENDRSIWITPTWSVIGMKNIGSTPDNIGTLIFLLCELGYDVTGQFNK